MNKDREVSLPLDLELTFRGVLGKATGRDYVGFGAAVVLQWEGHHVVCVSTSPWTPTLSYVEKDATNLLHVPMKESKTQRHTRVTQN